MATPALDRIEAARPQIEALCLKYAVTRLRVFGSALREDWNPETSDYDFLAEFGDPPRGMNRFHQFIDFILELEELLGRNVDVVDWRAATNPYFRRNAEESARTFYAA